MGTVLGIAPVFMMIEALRYVAAPRVFPLADDLVVDLPNPNLEAVIRETMRRPTGDIYQSDLTGLTVLVAGNTGIIDLSGLEYCTSLSTLSLYANQISDTVALSGLTGLTYCGHKQRKRMEG